MGSMEANILQILSTTPMDNTGAGIHQIHPLISIQLVLPLLFHREEI